MLGAVQYLALIGLLSITFLVGWAAGYKEGKQEQKEILVRLRRQIANSQS